MFYIQPLDEGIKCAGLKANDWNMYLLYFLSASRAANLYFALLVFETHMSATPLYFTFQSLKPQTTNIPRHCQVSSDKQYPGSRFNFVALE